MGDEEGTEEPEEEPEESKGPDLQTPCPMEFDAGKVRAKRGDAAWARLGLDEEILQRDMGDVESAEFEETNMFHTDDRDSAADRNVEAHELYVKFEGTADVPLFEENPRLRNFAWGEGPADIAHGAMHP